MIRVLKVTVAFLFSTLLFAFSAFGQQETLVGHFHDFPGYYNPALNKGGNYSEVGLIHRSQWSGLSYPNVSTLFFHYPPKKELPVLPFRSAGLLFQHEDYGLLNRTNIQAYSSNKIVGNRYYSLNAGISLGIQLNNVNMDGLDPIEISDPQFLLMNNRKNVKGRVGASYEYEKFQLGVSTALNNFTGFEDFIATVGNRFALKDSKFYLTPFLIYRYSSNGDSQAEIQVRTIYDKKIAFTAGYRQNYGAVLQLGILVSGIKGSYGSELPNKGESALGPTHEILLAYQFKMVNEKKVLRDTEQKAKRDSINLARLDSIRKARLLMYQTPEDNASQQASDSISKTVHDIEVNVSLKDEPEEADVAANDEVLSFEEIPSHIEEDNVRVILRQIVFEVGYDILKPYAYKELDKLVNYLKHNKRFKVEIQGHTDNIGTAEANLELSHRRALTVFNYLISRGIEESKMKAVGYGETQPLYKNDTEDHRQLNRRIEIVFMKE